MCPVFEFVSPWRSVQYLLALEHSWPALPLASVSRPAKFRIHDALRRGRASNLESCAGFSLAVRQLEPAWSVKKRGFGWGPRQDKMIQQASHLAEGRTPRGADEYKVNLWGSQNRQPRFDLTRTSRGRSARQVTGQDETRDVAQPGSSSIPILSVRLGWDPFKDSTLALKQATRAETGWPSFLVTYGRQRRME